MLSLVPSASGWSMLERPDPVAGPGELLLAPLWAGLCRTDVFALGGRFPRALGRASGHEFVARVLAAGPGADAGLVGRLVAPFPFLPCGRCHACLGGQGAHACGAPLAMGIDREGAFSTRALWPAALCEALPEALPPAMARRLAYAEPCAAALAPLAALDLSEPIALVGEGRIARLCEALLRRAGARELAFVADPERDASSSRFAAVIESRMDKASLAWACEALRPGGTLVLKSRTLEEPPLPARQIVLKGLSLRGMAYAPFRDAVELLLDPAFDAEAFFGADYPFTEQGARAMLADEASGEAKKLFLRINELDPSA